MSQQTAFKLISQLVSDFKTNESKYLSPAYSEADVRKDFIDKFFNALGWDVYHNEQKNPYEQEVKIERGVQMGRQQKRADYAFYLQPNFRDVKFYLEAKKPSRNLTNSDDYFQACRYGWNAGTSITFLTDFEELHILDCRTKPDITSILNNKIKKYHYSEYADKEKFAEIYWLLSREAVGGNSLEKFSESLPKPKGKTIGKGTHRGAYQSIDEAFLEELDDIRNSLARAFKKSNPHLGSDELTEMTQRTIDRLVFIRFLEDKQIEPDHYVSQFAVSDKAWKDFTISSRKLDAKYNGVVFKKHAIDTDNFIEPEDKTFSSICGELAHLNSPYNFDIIPIHILGSIYERFLGKVVIATDKRVRIEEKPEVRKAGGVYYTPQYIVNYIVDNTVGKMIEGKTPKEISKMHFADISCGSGSFLITVFDRLLEYHRKWYQLNPRQAKKDGCYFQDGVWILSLKQKQNILTNNIYGVDLDAQAVEVTQLSLYLKLLEDETTATAQDTWVMFKEQLLPNLNKNIICGNSLIGTDILEGKLFNREEELKLKPMNFEDVFPEVMANGGFDAIVGNPPYVQLSHFFEVKHYFDESFRTFSGNSDLYVLFIEKAVSLLRENTILGMIVSNKWLRADYGLKLRSFIENKIILEEIIDFGELPVFKNVGTFPCIIIAFNSMNKISKTKFTQIKKLPPNGSIHEQMNNNFINLTINNDCNGFWILAEEKTQKLLRKIGENSIELGELYANKIRRGVVSGYNEAFIIDEKTKKELIEKDKNANMIIKPFVSGDETRRYHLNWDGRYILFTRRNISINKFPSVKEHLQKFRRFLEPKKSRSDKTGRKPGKYAWYELQDSTNYFEDFDKPKIVYGQFQIAPHFCLSIEPLVFGSNHYMIVGEDTNDLFSLLGILNSQLYFFFMKNITGVLGDADNRGRIISQKSHIINFPIKQAQDDVKHHVRFKIVNQVNKILETKKQLHTAKTESEKEYLEKKCANIDRQIDALVYELYELTPEEIAIVENSVK